MNKDAINKWTLLLLVVFISAMFLAMIRPFLMAIFMAGIFSALSYPLYRRIRRWFGGRQGLASMATLFLIVFVIIIPLGALLGIVTAEAIKVGEAVTPWVAKQLGRTLSLAVCLATRGREGALRRRQRCI